MSYHHIIIMSIKTLKAISTIYMVVGCMMLMGADQLFFGIMAVICFMASAGYYDVAKSLETKLSNQWYEDGEYPDY